jgi:Phage capsid protein
MGSPSTVQVQQYANTIYLLAQQMTTYLRGTVRVDTDWVGNTKFYDQYNQDSMTELITRYATTPVQQPDFRRRAVSPRYFVSATLEDPKDALQMIVDPKSTMFQAKIAAAGRTNDDLIIAAFGGTAYTGQTGSTSVTFPSSNQITASQFPNAGNGMSKAKMLAAQRILNANEVEVENRYFAHGSAQLEDLLNTTEVTSSDYNVVKSLVQGDLKTWVGFSFVRTERLLTDASSNRDCYAYHEWAMQLGIQKDMEGRLDERIDLNMAWQVYLRMCMNATRLEEARIVQIACTENAF